MLAADGGGDDVGLPAKEDCATGALWAVDGVDDVPRIGVDTIPPDLWIISSLGEDPVQRPESWAHFSGPCPARPWCLSNGPDAPSGHVRRAELDKLTTFGPQPPVRHRWGAPVLTNIASERGRKSPRLGMTIHSCAFATTAMHLIDPMESYG